MRIVRFAPRITRLAAAATPLTLLVVCTASVTTAFAQDIVTTAPKNAKVEFENEQVRIVRLRMAPHETLPPHDRPARVVIALSANDVRITAVDGKPRMLHVPAENVGWGEPTQGRSVETLDSGFENVIVEIKNAKEPAKPVKHPPAAEDPRALIEPYHHWLFENQYVRVYDVRVPAGVTTQFHKHAYDSVFVQASDEVAAEQSPDGEWQKAQKYPAGEVAFSADFKKPRVHRVRNDGTREFHVVVVQLLP